MTTVKKSRVTKYSCEQLFNLVNDVRKYREFLPYCSDSIVHSENENEIEATLVISAAGMSKSFTTRNHIQPHKIIEIRLVDGPFSHLEGFWRFDEHANGSQISFDLEFEWAGSIFNKFLSPIFEQVTDKMVDAYCERAEKLYG